MSALGGWLYTLVAAALLVGILQGMMPEGTVKEVSRITGGLLLFLVLLRPLLGSGYGDFLSWVQQWQADAADTVSQAEEITGELTEARIAAECAAYLVQQAEAAGITCSVTVQCGANEDGLTVPVAVLVAGTLDEGEREVLRTLAREELGLAREQVTFTEGGEADEAPGD